MCNEVGKDVTHKALESLSVRVKPFIVWELRAKPSAIQKMYLQKNSLIHWVFLFFVFFSFQYTHISCFHYRVFKRIWINLYIRRAGCHIEKLVSLLFRQWCPGAGHLSLGELSVTCSGILRASVVAVQELMSDSLQLHELEHTRLPCPSLSPGACSDSCPLSR